MNFDFPFSQSILIYFGLSIVFLGLIMFLIMLYQKLSRTFTKNKDKKEKQPGCLIQIIKTLLILTLISTGFAFIFLGTFIQSLTNFTKKELVAEIWCQEISNKDYSMKLILIEKSGINANKPQQYYLSGNQWFIRGDIVKWKDWLNFFGLHTMYKLNRIGGYFTNVDQENEMNPPHYSLNPEEESTSWHWLFKWGYKLPMIDSVYGDSKYQYPLEQKKFKVFVTTSGFSIEIDDDIY